MAKSDGTILSRPIAIAERPEQSLVHQYGPRKPRDEKLSADVKCLYASLSVGIKLILEQGMVNSSCNLAPRSAYQNAGSILDDCQSMTPVMTAGSSSETNIFLLCRSGCSNVGAAAFRVRGSLDYFFYHSTTGF